MDRIGRRIKDKRVLALVKAFLKAGILTEPGDHEDTHTGTPQGGIFTPPTQLRTWAMVTLRIGFGVALPGAGAACAGRDAVPDGDLPGR